MIKPEAFLVELKAAGVEFYAGVPDSLLKEFLVLLQAEVAPELHHITVSEGAAVALAGGYHLATGKIPLVYMQNSGLGNAVNPLMSLSHCQVYGLPLLLLIGHRGAPNVKDEPQHTAMGSATLAILDNLAVPYQLLGPEQNDLKAFVARAVERVKTISSPLAIVVASGTFEKVDQKSAKKEVEYNRTRMSVLAALLSRLKGDEPIVASTGFNGRELYEARLASGKSSRGDFLNVGAMGHALPIAAGIALGKADQSVICIDGDGALLMHLGNLITVGKSAAAVRHLLINNGAHESVGGQPTGGAELDFAAMAALAGYNYAMSAGPTDDLDTVLDEFLLAPTPAFLEVRVDLGVKENLARPSSDFQGSKREFMRFLSGQ
ncbi:MAG: phosphonopyruvate decarboxylase [Cyanobacteria bacterium SZAS TMP-1]|nr:phosphonopyruvate decarboxylase [Cyanobacteria bacterium SZAS TMP-1]